MKKLLLLSLLLLLSPLIRADTEAEGQKQFFDIVYERIADNGEEMLCEQEAYTACFDADKAACIAAQSAHKADCLEAFTANRSENPGTNHTFVFMQCMKAKHVEAAQDSAPQAAECTEAAMSTIKFSPYSKRIEVVFALTVSDQRIAGDLCDQTTVFGCPTDTNDSCKERINTNKASCMADVKAEILSGETPIGEGIAGEKYMDCLMEKNECE